MLNLTFSSIKITGFWGQLLKTANIRAIFKSEQTRQMCSFCLN